MRFPTYTVTLEHSDTGAEPEVFDVYVDLMLDEADMLLRSTGLTWRDWLTGIDAGKPDALRFVYWLARKRAGDPVEEKFSEITFWLHALSTTVKDPGDFGQDDAPSTELVGPDPTEGVETASS